MSEDRQLKVKTIFTVNGNVLSLKVKEIRYRIVLFSVCFLFYENNLMSCFEGSHSLQEYI